MGRIIASAYCFSSVVRYYHSLYLMTRLIKWAQFLWFTALYDRDGEQNNLCYFHRPPNDIVTLTLH